MTSEQQVFWCDDLRRHILSFLRNKPKVINGSRKKRIAAGSGTSISDINKILKQHRKMSDMMKKLSKKGMGSIDPNMLGGQLGAGIPNDFFKNKF